MGIFKFAIFSNDDKGKIFELYGFMTRMIEVDTFSSKCNRYRVDEEYTIKELLKEWRELSYL